MLETSSPKASSLSRVGTILKKAANGWLEDNAPRLSAALAFYTILSVAPLLVIVTAIAGSVFEEDAASSQLIAQLRGVLGDSGADVVKSMMEKSDRRSSGVVASSTRLILACWTRGRSRRPSCASKP